jgi:uncharacterized protein (TIGR02266 family)
MRIKLKYPDVETFIQKYAVNISRGGIFIATKTPKPVGTPLKFEFLLANSDAGQSIIRGEGQVQWTREFDPQQPTKAHGMGVRFLRLDDESQAVVDRALAWRAAHSAAKGAPDAPTPPPSAVEPSRPVSLTPPPQDEPTTAVGPPAALADEAPRSPHEEITAAYPLPPESRPMMEARDPMEARVPMETRDAMEGRGPSEHTRPIAIPDAPLPVGDSQPVMMPLGRPKDVETKPIDLDAGRRRENGGSRRAGDELDALAAEWGLSEDRLSRVLRRRRPRMVEATAELERLLRKPPRAPAPSKAEARSLLGELLERKPAPSTQAAGGEPEPLSGKRNR